MEGRSPDLSGVPETMLWSLYHRAAESYRADRVLHDPEGVRIMEALDYDFAGHFGTPGGSLAARAAEMDRTIVRWLGQHPDGLVVSLGEGLETQALRVDNGRMRWLSVDLPEAIRLRENFLPPTERFRHLAKSALNPEWMAAVDASGPSLIVAQGLLMYLEPDAVGRLVGGMAERLPDAGLLFDTIPPWLSELTLRGLNLTPRYRLPRMPWGIARDDIEPTLRRWCPRLGAVEFLPYSMPHGLPLVMTQFMTAMPTLRNHVPSLVVTSFGGCQDEIRHANSAGHGQPGRHVWPRS
jgi:O-methyltransferase involved in polyketide biosynthesis